MENQNVKYLVMAFVFLILGAVLIGQVATNTNAVTEKTNVADESHSLADCVVDLGGALGFTINESDADCNITVTNYPTSWKVDDCPLTSIVVGNSTLDFTLDTDYEVFASSGVIRMLNTTGTANGFANTTLVDYIYCGDDYINSSWGRTVLDIVAGFFALALLAGALWLFYMVFKSTGLMNQ